MSIFKYFLVAITLASTLALAYDEKNLSRNEKGAFCTGIANFALAAVKEKRRGTPLAEILERLEGGMDGSSFGPQMKRFSRIVVREGYVTTKNENEYADEAQERCHDAF